MASEEESKKNWDQSFSHQIASGAYNTAPVEALARTVSYYLRARRKVDEYGDMRFLEVGCGGGINLIWLAQKGIRVSGLDISPVALELAHRNLTERGLSDKIDRLVEGSAGELPFQSGIFDGVIEACVFQHLDRTTREKAFAEVGRVLKPGGVFVGYMLSDAHTNYIVRKHEELKDDPGTLLLQDEKKGARVTLETLGLTHFFQRDEFPRLLSSFAEVDPCALGYDLPREEARRRGVEHYHQGMWNLYAIR